MACAEYSINRRRVAMRNFHVPKRASELKYWYKAIGKAIPELPPFEERFLRNADVDVDHIILSWLDEGILMHHLLMVSRKKELR